MPITAGAIGLGELFGAGALGAEAAGGAALGAEAAGAVALPTIFVEGGAEAGFLGGLGSALGGVGSAVGTGLGALGGALGNFIASPAFAGEPPQVQQSLLNRMERANAQGRFADRGGGGSFQGPQSGVPAPSGQVSNIGGVGQLPVAGENFGFGAGNTPMNTNASALTGGGNIGGFSSAPGAGSPAGTSAATPAPQSASGAQTPDLSSASANQPNFAGRFNASFGNLPGGSVGAPGAPQGGVPAPGDFAPSDVAGGNTSFPQMSSDGQFSMVNNEGQPVDPGNFADQPGVSGGGATRGITIPGGAPETAPGGGVESAFGPTDNAVNAPLNTSASGQSFQLGSNSASPAGVTAPGAAAPTGATGQAPGGGFLNDLGQGAMKSITNNPLGLLAAGGLLGYDLLKGNPKSDPQKVEEKLGMQQIAQGGQLMNQGQKDMSYLTNGTLPAGQQAAVDRAHTTANAMAQQQAGHMGVSGDPRENSMLASNLQANAQNALITSGDIEAKLAQLGAGLIGNGITLTGMGSQTEGLLMQLQGQQDQAWQQAIANLARAFSPSPTINIGKMA